MRTRRLRSYRRKEASYAIGRVLYVIEPFLAHYFTVRPIKGVTWHGPDGIRISG
jgi:hypothetical protein